ncbi:hypothetical protein QBC38DRAFT_456154, partial [Podospora fimiseda]
MDFVDRILLNGCKFVGFGGSTLHTLLADCTHEDVFVLYFNESLRQSSDIWTDTLDVFDELLSDTSAPKTMIAVDCDACAESIEAPYISHLRNRRIYIRDLLEHRKVQAVNCIMCYDEKAMDSSITSKPLQRRAVRIPCPHPDCDKILRCNWICSICHYLVEYGYVDDRLYCSCGACPYDRWRFKCKGSNHGSSWLRCDNTQLMVHLKGLKALNELNILILGETGVGKSTWINAFVNYLTHASLDEAVQADDLKCLVPCSFSTQLKDPSDPQGRFIQKDN